jgi:hypothetical protein
MTNYGGKSNEYGEISQHTASRRDFMKCIGAAAVVAGFPAGPASSTASQTPLSAAQRSQIKVIKIQIGAVSFTDEGVEKVLDILQPRAGVNALILAAFTYGRGIAGRQIPGQPLPDHGAQQYDDQAFHRGDYAKVHPQYYKSFQKPVQRSKFTVVFFPWRRVAEVKCARGRADGAIQSVADRRPVGKDPALAPQATAATAGRSASGS